MAKCELCDLVVKRKVKTRHYYTDLVVTIVDCLTCGEGHPMLVFSHHGQATDEKRRHATGIIDRLFEYESIRKEARKIMNHEHWHILGAKLINLTRFPTSL